MSSNIKSFLANKSNDYSDLEVDFSKKTNKSLIFDHCSIDNLNHSEVLSASVVIPAWNAQETILSCLTAIEKSSFNKKYPEKLEVVVTDDGSTDNTLKILKQTKLNLNMTVLHQDNYGQGQAMNAGISAAQGDIIIEVDADTILNYYAIENLMVRHQFHKNALYTGFRHYLNKGDYRVDLEYLRKNGPDSESDITNDERLKYPVAGWPNNMCTSSNHYKTLGNSKGLWMGNDDNDDPWILADMVFGMLFSLPRDIFNKIGGFDDRFKGWGCDDGYVGAKAISEGIFVIPVYTATGLHISHPFRTEDKQTEYDFNRKFFFDFINSTDYQGHPNWIVKAEQRIKSKHKIKRNTANPLSSAIADKSPEPNTVEQLLAVGKYLEAHKALLLDSHDKTEAYYHRLGGVLIGQKKHQECISVLQKACKNLTSDNLLFQLVRAHSATGNFVEARSLLEKIAKNNPDYPELEYWLNRDYKANLRQGVKYVEQSFYETAKVCFEVVLISDPKNSQAMKYRKMCTERIKSSMQT